MKTDVYALTLGAIYFTYVVSVHLLQTSQKQLLSREQGEERAQDASEAVIYKIEVPANR